MRKLFSSFMVVALVLVCFSSVPAMASGGDYKQYVPVLLRCSVGCRDSFEWG